MSATAARPGSELFSLIQVCGALSDYTRREKKPSHSQLHRMLVYWREEAAARPAPAQDLGARAFEGRLGIAHRSPQVDRRRPRQSERKADSDPRSLGGSGARQSYARQQPGQSVRENL